MNYSFIFLFLEHSNRWGKIFYTTHRYKKSFQRPSFLFLYTKHEMHSKILTLAATTKQQRGNKILKTLFRFCCLRTTSTPGLFIYRRSAVTICRQKMLKIRFSMHLKYRYQRVIWCPDNYPLDPYPRAFTTGQLFPAHPPPDFYPWTFTRPKIFTGQGTCKKLLRFFSSYLSRR